MDMDDEGRDNSIISWISSTRESMEDCVPGALGD